MVDDSFIHSVLLLLPNGLNQYSQKHAKSSYVGLYINLFEHWE